MRQFLNPGILALSAICFGATLMAAPQYRPYDYGDRTYSQPASPVSDFRAGQMLFASVRSDLDRAENNMPEYSADRYSFDRVRGELSELQHQWDETAYEPSQADHVIRALDRVLTSPDILGRDRDRLSADRAQLRDFRDSHE
jgi:hypothetical protein